MAMKEDDKYSSPKTTEKRADEDRGIVLIIIDSVIGTIKWLLISLLFSILVSFVGVTFIWDDIGSEHERMTLETEVSYLAEELDNTAFVSILASTQGSVIWKIPQMFGDTINSVVAVFNENLVLYGDTANFAMRIFFVRVILLITSLPILVMYGIAAFYIGLVERDLRRFNLARESSTKFHLILNNVHVPLIWLMMLYLSWPVTAHPLPFILPGYLIFGSLVFVMTAGYKKYF